MSNRSSSSLSYAVRPRVVLKHLAQLSLPLTGMLLLPLLLALFFADWSFALRLALVTALLTGIAVPLSRIEGAREIQRNEALCVTALLFVLAAVIMIWPLQVAGMAAIDALFESVSGITTTGLSTLASVEALPRSVLFARSWMQWYGGLVIVVLALALVLEPGPVAMRLREAGSAEDELAGSTRARARRLLLVYVTLAVTATVVLVATGMPFFDALIHGLSAVSTGGFSSHDASIAALPTVASAAVCLSALAGAVSFAGWYRAGSEGWRPLAADVELKALLALVLMLACLLFVSETYSGGRLGGADALLLAASAQSTTGFAPVAVSELSGSSQLLLIASMLIGGSAGSTAGGIKIVRLLLVLRLLQLVIARSALAPHAVSELEVAGMRPGERELQSILLIVLLYPGLAVLSWLCFLVAGEPALASLFEVTSALGTVGLSAGVATPDLPGWLKAVLCVDMLAGRLEIVALLVLLHPGSWFGQRADLP